MFNNYFMGEVSDGLVYLDPDGNAISWEESCFNDNVDTSIWVEGAPNRMNVAATQERLRGLVLHAIENPDLPETQKKVLEWVISTDRALLKRLLLDEQGSLWEIPPVSLIKWFSEDPNKLWESGLKGFEESGKYNQISLDNSGRLIITIIKPGVMESLRAKVDPQFVELIREQSPLDWDRTGEGFKHGHTGLGGIYEFVRIVPLLRQGPNGYNIDLRWIGRHTNPVIEWGNYHVDDEATIIARPTNYHDPE